MLAEFFESPARIQELTDGPDGGLLEWFAQELCQPGYAEITARRPSALMKNDPPMLARNDPGARQTTMKWNARSPEETLPDLPAVVLSGSARGETATSLR